ncbi:hypothetical protein [Blastococcus mobilis]|uniref:Uncharacterized protein n=1 Tax=Blastococcus mobilis TaxID=1938746 RepID=A0A238VGZ4_9ACTN|nr:hypothetical protein [Blastococcus mobilis]SNR33448.1 hypothetical protein SAMN06272737_103135 [Blastococcus mobilis]
MTGANWGPPAPSPWADPATPTEQGAPYAGPPATTQPYPGAYGYPAAYHPAPQWGPPAPWGPVPPRPPQRPGQLITAAVLALAQAVVTLIASLYLWFIASIADLAAAGADGVPSPAAVDALATEGTVLAVVQVLAAVVLAGGGVWALNTRRRGAWRLLVAALAAQVLLAGYWAVRLLSEIGAFGSEGAIASFSLFFAAGPLVGLGMLLVGPGRRWFGSTRQA